MYTQTPNEEIEVYIADLSYINDAIKALKQKRVALINNTIVGLDNLEQYICYTVLDSSMLSSVGICYITTIIESAELSSFINHITTESSFKYYQNNPVNTWTTNQTNEGVFMVSLRYDRNTINFVQERLNMVTMTNNSNPNAEIINIDDDIQRLRAMKKTDGSFYLVHRGLFITLFPGLLPLVKVDKVFLTTYDVNDHSFIAKFTIQKKKFQVYVYLAYLKVQ